MMLMFLPQLIVWLLLRRLNSGTQAGTAAPVRLPVCLVLGSRFQLVARATNYRSVTGHSLVG